MKTKSNIHFLNMRSPSKQQKVLQVLESAEHYLSTPLLCAPSHLTACQGSLVAAERHKAVTMGHFTGSTYTINYLKYQPDIRLVKVNHETKTNQSSVTFNFSDGSSLRFLCKK